MGTAASAMRQPSEPQSVQKTAAAFFDVDGTLVDATIVHYYIYFRRRLMTPTIGRIWHSAYLLKCAYYLVLDRINRSRFNVAFYHDYAGMDAHRLIQLAPECFREVIEPRLFPDGVACIAEHLQAGRRVVLVTGSLDFLMAPLAQTLGVKDVVAARMRVQQGRLTGELDGPPIGEHEKAQRVARFAEANGIDLSSSYAYGDSVADAPMLDLVGFANVVNPSRSLEAMARSRGWSVHRWSRSAGSCLTEGAARG